MMQLDHDAKALTHEGEVLYLSRRQYDVLAVLMARPGRVFARDQIIDLAYFKDADIDPRNIDSHVKRIRRMMERMGWPRFLHTRQSFGYVWQEEEFRHPSPRNRAT